MNNCLITVDFDDVLEIKLLKDDKIILKNDDYEAEKVRGHFPIIGGGKYIVYSEGELCDKDGELLIKIRNEDGSFIFMKLSNGCIRSIEVSF